MDNRSQFQSVQQFRCTYFVSQTASTAAGYSFQPEPFAFRDLPRATFSRYLYFCLTQQLEREKEGRDVDDNGAVKSKVSEIDNCIGVLSHFSL